jgi:hypothetical protein
MHEHKAQGQLWLQLIGVANKNAVFATLMGLTKGLQA